MEKLIKIVDSFTGEETKQQQISGSVVVVKKDVLGLNDFAASVADAFHELAGRTVSLRLISSTHTDENALTGKVGKPANLKKWTTSTVSLTPSDSVFAVTFDWDSDGDGVPGAFLIRSSHHAEFFLKTLTLDHVPGHGRLHFVCNSWVYPSDRYGGADRIFFYNQAYLPADTPPGLLHYRQQELVALRGDGNGELREWDRVYDYDYYNDLGDPDKDDDYARPVLGGSPEYPYPRRGRTGRPPSKTDPKTESRIPLLKGLSIHVPRDERYGHLKMSDFLADGIKSIVQYLLPMITDLCDTTSNEFDSFEDLLGIYKGGINLPDTPLVRNVFDKVPWELVKELFRREGHEGLFKFPMPSVIQEDKSAWRTDEEFAREMLAGVNPVLIRRLQEFPPKSKLNTAICGDQNSKITEDHVVDQLDGFTIDEALKANRLFILDHHDTIMPYLRRINSTTSKIYASRTILFQQNDGCLKPLAIELSLPHSEGDQFGSVSEVYTPAVDGVEGCIWQLAKAYVAVNDSGVHQLISHWLNTHAVMEPFVIATNRQLSVLHPIHKLLQPHFRDTMNINAYGRQVVINAGGILETTVFPAKYSMEMSSAFYKNWTFPDQALPADLLKRGMAMEDPNSPNGLRLVIEDYPYAVDGLKIWSAIETWVDDYCRFYYKSDGAVQADTELQSWWKELREEGHGDKRDEPWWPRMQTREDLIRSCTIVVWTASALHAALNFGQYPYAGYMPNRPTLSRRLMPAMEEVRADPDGAFLRTITARMQALLGIALIEILSQHSSDEVYLGQRETPEWTRDEKPVEDLEKMRRRLAEIEGEIVEMNRDGKWKNRVGPVQIPYTLLYPSSGSGMTGKGIPNSVSI